MKGKTPLVDRCDLCAALCCVSFAFEKSEAFAVDKAAGQSCSHLCADGQCGVHADRDKLGFSGCIGFTCHGAGTYVTQNLFAGRSWQDDPILLKPMMAAFYSVRQIHELLALLETAADLPLDEAKMANHRQLMADLSPEDGWSTETLEIFDHADVSAKVNRFLQSLKSLVSRAV